MRGFHVYDQIEAVSQLTICHVELFRLVEVQPIIELLEVT
jgi:hypothetical protein